MARSVSLFQILVVVFMLTVMVAWPLNVYRLLCCDFQPPYKAEIIRGLGVFVFPLSVVLVPVTEGMLGK